MTLKTDRDYEVFKAGWEAGRADAKKYGQIINGIVLREYVGSGDVNIGGNTVQFSLSIGLKDSAPLVTLGNRTFVLTWSDIVELADAAGLFDDSEVTA